MRIACVHQGFELYGSDRAFVESVSAIREAFPQAEIEVVLPQEGPILSLLEGKADRITFEPLWVLRRTAFLRLLMQGIFTLPGAIFKAWKRLGRNDLVYINTCVIADYMLASRLRPGKALLHIHEIPEGGPRAIIRTLVRISGAAIIFNSQATRNAFVPIGQHSGTVVYNGVAAPAQAEETTFDGKRPLRLLMLGRINRIKGQEVLLAAIESLPPALRNRITLRIVGGVFGNDTRESALRAMVTKLGLESQVSIEPFVADPAELYRWADVVAVPSRLPESLGRVAIEAMAYGRPAIVSAIGGLTEVISHGETGWHVIPDNSADLAARLAAILEDPAVWAGFGSAGRARYEAIFSESTARNAIANRVRKFLDHTSEPSKP